MPQIKTVIQIDGVTVSELATCNDITIYGSEGSTIIYLVKDSKVITSIQAESTHPMNGIPLVVKTFA